MLKITDTVLGRDPLRVDPSPSDRKQKDLAALTAVAESFEAYFYELILKNSRQTKLSESLTGEDRVFGQMLDKNFSEIISKRNSSEISRSIINQFKKYL
ncbi:MAG: hypothetical protein VW226_06745 [Rhodospirillaceae bacterium]